MQGMMSGQVLSRTMVFSDVFGANRGRGIVFRGGVFGAEGWFRLLTGLVSACDALVGECRKCEPAAAHA